MSNHESKPSIDVPVDSWDADETSWDEMAEEATRPVSPISGAPVPKGPGRPKGRRNDVTILRAAFLEAFDRTGGVDYLIEWAQKSSTNYKVFIQTLAKILPKDDNVQGDVAVQVINYVREKENDNR